MSESIQRLESLYREYGPALLGYLRRTFRKNGSAEDLLHDTFVQALRHPERLLTADSPRAWLFTIARRVGLTAMRKKQAGPLSVDQLEAPANVEPDSRLIIVRKTINELPEPYRQTLLLRLHEQLTYEEIAQVLDIPIGTVRSRLHHAITKLRDTIHLEKSP